MEDCLFCGIAASQIEAALLWEDDDVVAFLDPNPIREGHALIIPRLHAEDFAELPASIAARIQEVGQRLARRMKTLYRVERVAFLYTGSDVPHAHAHVVPMHEKTDITSARYIVHPDEVVYDSSHLTTDMLVLKAVARNLRLE